MWVYIEDFKNHVGETVILKGWVFNKRSSGKIHFLQLRDGTGTTQGIMEKAKVEESLFEKAKGLRIESSVEVEGVVREDARSKGGYELDVTGLRILQIPVEEYPITKKEHGTEFLMEQRHLWLRSTNQSHIMKVRNDVIRANRAFTDEQGFPLIDPPIFTGAIGEGAGNLFQLDYFDYGKAYLTQTGQLYLEAACMSFGKVYNLGPTFRAEKSKTRSCLLYTSDAADDLLCVDLGGRRIIKKKKHTALPTHTIPMIRATRQHMNHTQTSQAHPHILQHTN